MNKKEVYHFLKRLTPRELYFKESMIDKIEDNSNQFDTYRTFNGENVYRYTFEKHLGNFIEKDPQISKNLENSPLLICKHNRFSYTPLHSHDFIELNYVYTGSVQININGQKVTLCKGDLCILDTDVIHQILNTTENDILVNILMKKEYFTTNMLSRLASNGIISQFIVNSISEAQNYDQYIIFNTQESEQLFDAVNGLIACYFDKSFYSTDVINAYMIIIFSELLKSYKKEKSMELRRANHHYIGDVLQFIEEHYGDCSLSDVAAKFSFNTSYLSRYIKSSTGKSFVAIVQEIRLNHACALLKNTNYSIEYISQQVGYNNVTFFYQKFKETYQLTPNEFRKLHTT
ncbi:AraC family transcriptional regulator [Paenibacillus kribbensis]|uniref:AraC family transcriptional regulator n=1 Tax=Paenibacillus kribbensis TaxID=172713 RepID=UPI0015BDE784|nr:AraC family transcriptional regulator [Paenibacillus kribbensis]